MRLSLALGLAAPLLLLPVPAAGVTEQPVEGVDCESVDLTTERYDTDAPSGPLELMGIEAAHALAPAGRLPGAGVNVAVVDSGVYAGDSDLLEVEEGISLTRVDELLDPHGTAVAGLVAGKPRGGEPTGVAPGATIIDVRVYDSDEESSDEAAVAVEPTNVVRGLEWVAQFAQARDIGVVVVPLRVEHSGRLEAVVRRLHRREDVVVVAASGNRPAEGTDSFSATYADGPQPGEDAVGDVFPAGYDDVVAVSATVAGHPDEAAGADATGFVLQNSATDVAAPTYGGVSVAVNGSTCVLPHVATSWAAAEVAGVVALLRQRYDDDSAAQIVARLEESASGSTDDLNVLTGAGVVQPVEALTRPLSPDRGGDVDRGTAEASTIPPATAPEPEADALDAAVDDAVWWGLFGGGAVVLALLLRPVLARRR